MNFTLIAAIVGGVLLAAVGVEGWMLLDAHDQIGEQKAQIVSQAAVIKQAQHDQVLSDRLATLQTKIETALKTTGAQTRQAINNAPSDDAAATAAIAGVMRLRAGQRAGSQTP